MDDLVSRAEAIRAFAEKREVWYGNGPLPSNESLMWQAAISITEKLPAVDAVPVVHGRWVDEKGNPVPWCDALPSSPAYNCWCNQCGTWLVASDEYPVYGLFCPACGAKMKEDERRDSECQG